MQKFFLSIVSCILICLTGCSKQQTKKITTKQNEPVAHVPVIRQFQAHIEGIECEFCAQDVVDEFKKIDGMHFVDFVMTDTQYEHGYICFAYDVNKGNIDSQKLDEKLLDEGFELISIDGSFVIVPMMHEGKPFVALSSDIVMPMRYGNNMKMLKRIIPKDDVPRIAQGKVIKDMEQGTFSFILLQET